MVSSLRGQTHRPAHELIEKGASPAEGSLSFNAVDPDSDLAVVALVIFLKLRLA
jgi:hypothetical protein